MRVGYDIDGVLTVERKIITEEQARSATRSRLKMPIAFDVFLISGRSNKLEDITKKWLEKHQIDYEKLYLKDYSHIEGDFGWEDIKDEQAEWKSVKINDLGLDFYIEDQEYLVKKLKKRCDGCRILHFIGEEYER